MATLFVAITDGSHSFMLKLEHKSSTSTIFW